MGTLGITAEEAPIVLSGLTAFETGEADFADYMILNGARRAQALPLWTFDATLAKVEGAARVL